jgi:hypothetical protein
MSGLELRRAHEWLAPFFLTAHSRLIKSEKYRIKENKKTISVRFFFQNLLSLHKPVFSFMLVL